MARPKIGTKIEVSIEETDTAMAQLLYGTQAASIKLAFWNSMLSLQVKLPVNCRHARVMARYVNRPLPPMWQLINELGGEATEDTITRFPSGLMTVHFKGLYAIESLYNQGMLDFDCGDELDCQRAWRDRMVDLIPGMGSKLVSWALFIYDPFNCKLMTVDTVHCSRIGIDQRKLSGSGKAQRAYYRHVEDMLRGECLALFPDRLPAVTAACLWLNFRNEGITSHREISCRWY